MVIFLQIFFLQILWAVPEDLTVIQEQAREVMKVHTCGGCHTPGLASAKEGALKVYNLGAPFWAATMSDRQLPDFQRRFKAQEGVSAEHKRVVIGFIDKEIRNRREDSSLRFRQLQESKFPDFYKMFEAVKL